MLDFLAQNWGTIVVGVIVAAVLVFASVRLIRNKKAGKTNCGCGCENCPSSGMCHKK